MINEFMDQLVSEIKEVQDDYQGFIDLEDKEFFEKQAEINPDERELEEKYTQLKRDYGSLKLKVQELETEITKKEKKEKLE